MNTDLHKQQTHTTFHSFIHNKQLLCTRFNEDLRNYIGSISSSVVLLLHKCTIYTYLLQEIINTPSLPWFSIVESISHALIWFPQSQACFKFNGCFSTGLLSLTMWNSILDSICTSIHCLADMRFPDLPEDDSDVDLAKVELWACQAHQLDLLQLDLDLLWSHTIPHSFSA